MTDASTAAVLPRSCLATAARPGVNSCMSKGRLGQVDSEAVRNGRYKLVRISGPDGEREELYDLRRDPYEERDLLAAGNDEATQIYSALMNEIRRLRAQ